MLYLPTFNIIPFPMTIKNLIHFYIFNLSSINSNMHYHFLLNIISYRQGH